MQDDNNNTNSNTEDENSIDLFDYPELIPKEVLAILETFEDETYLECERVLNEIKKHGYTFDYYLTAQPFDLRKL